MIQQSLNFCCQCLSKDWNGYFERSRKLLLNKDKCELFCISKLNIPVKHVFLIKQGLNKFDMIIFLSMDKCINFALDEVDRNMP